MKEFKGMAIKFFKRKTNIEVSSYQGTTRLKSLHMLRGFQVPTRTLQFNQLRIPAAAWNLHFVIYYPAS